MKNPIKANKRSSTILRKIEFNELRNIFKKCFFSQEISLKDWEKLEAKKKMNPSDRSQFSNGQRAS